LIKYIVLIMIKHNGRGNGEAGSVLRRLAPAGELRLIKNVNKIFFSQ